MLRSPLNLFRTSRTPSPAEHTPPGRSPGSSPGSSPRTSPAHADLTSRARQGGEAAQPTLRSRNPDALARLARLPRQAAAEPGAAGPSSPQRPQVGSGQALEREAAQWVQEAVARLPSVPPRGINYIDRDGTDTRPQRIKDAASAVSLAAATNARQLQIQYLPTSSLPPGLWQLKGLQELNLNFNSDLTKLPESIASLKNLTKLSVHGAPLESLPTAIGGLPKLDTLSLSGGSYEELPLGFTRLGRSLQSLEITHSRPAPGGGRGLKKLPADIGRFSLLENLKLSGHKELAEIPAGVGDLTQLRTLDLSGCSKLTDLPDLSKLRHLKTLDLSGCTSLSARPAWRRQLPGCEVIWPEHLSRRRPVRESPPSPERSSPRSPEETAQREQKLGNWVAQLQPFARERGSGRFNLWMGAMIKRQVNRPGDMDQLNDVVKAAAASPAFRAKLFAFAAANVEIPRDPSGRQLPAQARVAHPGVDDAHRMLILHRMSDPETDSRQAYSVLRQMAIDTVDAGFGQQLLTFGAPSRRGSGSQRAEVPKLLEAYVKTHDEEGKTIMETMRSLERRHGRSSGPDLAAAMQPLEDLLHARCLAVARQLQSM